jgi:GAF domain-containing protein
MSVDAAALAASLQALGADPAMTASVSPLSGRLARIVGAAQDLLAVNAVGVLLLGSAHGMRTAAATGPVAAALERSQESLALGPGMDAVTSGKVVRVTDLADDSRYATLWSAVEFSGSRSVLAAPIFARGTVIGNLNAIRSDAHAWTDFEANATAQFADFVGSLVDLAAIAAEAEYAAQIRAARLAPVGDDEIAE